MEKLQELKDSRKKAKKLREELIKAYRILEKADYKFTSETMFVEYMVVAKRKLEGAINDYIVSDDYWKFKIEQHINE